MLYHLSHQGIPIIKHYKFGNPLAAQWLGFHISTVGSMALIPGRGTKTPQASGSKKKKTKTPNPNPYKLGLDLLILFTFEKVIRTSLAVQWLRLCSNAGGMGMTPGQGTKIPYAVQHGQ